MMLFEYNVVACRCCGAKKARGVLDDHGLCEWCDARFQRVTYRVEKFSEYDVNAWLARELFMAARRLERYGVSRRCQAISQTDVSRMWAGFQNEFGGQCKRWATATRDGRPVCVIHAERTGHPVYVDDEDLNPYEQFTRLMTELGQIDPRFRECLSEAVAACRKDEAA